MFNHRLPSFIKNSNGDNTVGLYVSWYLGITENVDEVANKIFSNYHVDLINDESRKEDIKACLDISIIPEKYKTGRSYYEDYETQKNYIYPKLEETSWLRKDKKLVEKLSQVFNIDISPGLASLDSLKGLLKAMVLACECDALKDDNLIYAERLKMAGVDVDTYYYEKGFHGSLQMSQTMTIDIIDYLKNNL